jgi:predicted RNA-binding protein with PUA-like domain
LGRQSPSSTPLRVSPFLHALRRLPDLSCDHAELLDSQDRANHLQLRRSAAGKAYGLVYHSGKEKALVGLAEIVKAPYPDPEQDDPKLVVMDIEAKGSLRRRVTLAEIKSDGSFEDLALVRLPRLSVVPVPAPQWNKLLRLGGKS